MTEEADPELTRVIELWQVQGYRPLKGWGSIKNVPHYFDTFVHSSHDALPALTLPQGWIWTSEWTVDMSRCFGDIEAVEGWMYGVSLDKLFNSLKSQSASGQMNPRSAIRCRRWLRTMTCDDIDAYDLINQNLNDLHDRCDLINDVMNENRVIHNAIHDYEERRGICHRKILEDLSKVISHDLSTILQLAKRLIMMKEYCIKRARADQEYCHYIQSLSQKHLQPASSSTSMIEEEDLLLQRIDEVNYSFTEQYSRLATLLSSVMMEDIDSLIMQSNQVFQSYENHLAQEYALLDSQQQLIHSAVSNLNGCFQTNQIQSHEHIQILHDEIKLFQYDGDDHSSSSSPSIIISNVVAYHVFGIKKVNLPTEDFFHCVYDYRKVVYDSTCLLTALQQVSQSIKLLSIKLSNQCHEVITIIAKYLAGEQAKIWLSHGESLLLAIEPSNQNSPSKLKSSSSKGMLRGYSLPDPPKSPSPHMLYDRLLQRQLQELIHMLQDLPSCPRIVVRDYVEVADIINSNHHNATASAEDWSQSPIQLVLTFDGYVHLLRYNGFAKPLRSLNTRHHTFKLSSTSSTAATSSDDVGEGNQPTSVCIQPIHPSLLLPTSTSMPVKDDSMNISSQNISRLSRQPSLSSSSFSLHDIKASLNPNNLISSIQALHPEPHHPEPSLPGMMITFPSYDAATSFISAIDDIHHLISIEELGDDLPLPWVKGITTKLYRENQGILNPIHDDDNQANIVYVDLAYDDLSIALASLHPDYHSPPRTHDDIDVHVDDDDVDRNVVKNIFPSSDISTGMVKDEMMTAKADDGVVVRLDEHMDDVQIDSSIDGESKHDAMMDHDIIVDINPPDDDPLAIITVFDDDYDDSDSDDDDDESMDADVSDHDDIDSDPLTDPIISSATDIDDSNTSVHVDEYIDDGTHMNDDISPSSTPVESIQPPSITPAPIHDMFEASATTTNDDSTDNISIKQDGSNHDHTSPTSSYDIIPSMDDHDPVISLLEKLDDKVTCIHTSNDHFSSCDDDHVTSSNPAKQHHSDDDHVINDVDEDDHRVTPITEHHDAASINTLSHDQQQRYDDNEEKIYDYGMHYPSVSDDDHMMMSSHDAYFGTDTHTLSAYQDMDMALSGFTLQSSEEFVKILEEYSAYDHDEDFMSDDDDGDFQSDDELEYDEVDENMTVDNTEPNHENNASFKIISDTRLSLSPPTISSSASSPTRAIGTSPEHMIDSNSPTRRHRRRTTYLTADGKKLPMSQAALRYQKSLQDAIFAATAAANGHLQIPGSFGPNYVAPKKLIPSDIDPSAPFARKDSVMVRNYQQGLAQEKEKTLARVSSMRVHHAAMSRLIKQLKRKSVGIGVSPGIGMSPDKGHGHERGERSNDATPPPSQQQST